MAAGGAAGRLTSPAIIEAALPASGILLDEHVKDISPQPTPTFLTVWF